MIGIGDELLAAGQAERLYREVGVPVSICDISGRRRWHPIWEGNPAIARPETAGPVQMLVSAPHARPYIVYPFTASSGWTFNQDFHAREHIAKIYLTDDELALGQETLERFGPYVLIEPYTKHPNLQWPFEYWQDLVSSALPNVTFVQHVHAESKWLNGVQHVTATFREACGLALFSRLYVRTESGMVHAAAALGCRQVTIWGGCMDWNVMSGYPGQISVINYTAGSPCGQWEPCEHCRESMAGISVKQVSDAITRALGA